MPWLARILKGGDTKWVVTFIFLMHSYRYDTRNASLFNVDTFRGGIDRRDGLPLWKMVQIEDCS